MIAWDKILSEMIGVVGWRQSTVTGDVVIDTANLSSSSGLYVQGAHPQVTVKNIKSTQEDKAITDVNINVVLANLVKDGISNVLNYVFPKPDIFANDLLYQHESDFSTPLTQFSGFVGYEINTAASKDIVSILNKIILQFNGSGNVKLLLFNSGVKLPIQTKTVAVTADTNITAVLDWVLGYITAPAGKYYLGFLTTGITIYPYNRVFSWANIQHHFNSIVLVPIYVPDWTAETLFDIKNIVYRAETMGMNFDITIARDYSNVILQNKDRFAKAIQLSTAVQALALMTTTGRINPEERVIMSTLGQKVVIDSPATFNLYSSLEKELKSLATLFGQKLIQTQTLR
jgi:hypothetical protein